jgi:photosystem II stability/assembly factor-like uncharacterized protein
LILDLIRRATRSVAALVAVLLAASAVSACGGDEPDDGPVISDPGPVHVHGLGINPRDGALFIATHTGLFRAGPSERQASRVGGRYQDTMGFTVVGPDRFLGSGHPDGRDNLPPFLGLIESRDGGKSWKPISLLGKSDFHVLEAAGARVYGFGSDFESRRPQFLVSSDGGKTWDERRVPEPLISLAVHPDDPDRLIASGESAVFESRDGGESWRRRSSAAGLVAWRSPEELIVIGANGSVRSSDDAVSWRDIGDVGGQPAAFEAERDGLYVGLHDGTINRSTDGGRSWSVRSRP